MGDNPQQQQGTQWCDGHVADYGDDGKDVDEGHIQTDDDEDDDDDDDEDDEADDDDDDDGADYEDD